MLEFDPGPPPALADLFGNPPDYSAFKDLLWFDWGPIYHRGRLDGSARLLCIASDPGPTERIAHRTLVGDAGQRVQGFLAKLGLTRSYVLVNAFLFALHPSQAGNSTAMHNDPGIKGWRNQLMDRLKTPAVQAIVAFGEQAQQAAQRWPGKAGVPLFEVPHPSSRNPGQLAAAWKDAITQLRAIVTPDPDGDTSLPNYGTGIKEADYAPIPHRDLPFGVPAFLGDDAWGRKASPRHNNQVDRQGDFKIIWTAPKS
ncbi:MAG: uracil-DNA glycosylase family protein [Bryobacteraceae bacterium]